MKWIILDTGADLADVIMQKDKELLDDLVKEQNPILHLYQFRGKSATYGHFLKPADFFCEEKVKELGLDLARRPTGGGIIFHLWDFAFSVLIPTSHPWFSLNTLDNYAVINRAVLSAVEEFLSKEGEGELTKQDGAILSPGCAHFCMAKPTQYDVMFLGKKIAGAAQRQTKAGFLHQGSISLLMPSKDFLDSVLRPGLTVVEGMFTYTFPLLGSQATEVDLAFGRQQIKQLVTKHITGYSI